ncbi:MAG TPA: PBP1A family penicillin-binding protein, partial [Candidatus Obscuribacterales bacterium]
RLGEIAKWPGQSLRLLGRRSLDSLKNWRPGPLSTIFLIVAGVLFWKTMTGFSLVNLPTLEQQGAGIQVFDRFDRLVCTAQEKEQRAPVPLDRISKHMKEAIIASEDRNFHHHPGIDASGIARALIANIKAGQVVEGGSTITQQLVKSLYLDAQDRSLVRKALEALMALEVDTYYSKDKILETYLNHIYFGSGAYGIERAAITYFNKHASQLNISESAFLAGLVKAPSELGRASNRVRALERQREVLDAMVEAGFIDREVAAGVKKRRLAFHRGPHALKHPYYVSQVLELAYKKLGQNMWHRGLRIYTHLDPSAQSAAEETLSQGIRRAPRGVSQGALVSIAVRDGGVLAIVGGAQRFENSQWNRAVHPHTAGSAFKPFVYLAGLIHNAIGPASMLYDAPIVVTNNLSGQTYTPRNFDGSFFGPMTVRDALAFSRNIPAVWVAQETGIDNVIDVARKAGITSAMDPYPSLALGTCAVSPLEMATAYATLARSGVYVAPQFIRRIEDEHGKTIVESSKESSHRLPVEPVRQIVDALKDVVNRGTGTAARLSGIPVAGKTGTADESKDIWFIGFTPEVVTAVWAGNDDNRPVSGNHVTGGGVMAAIWRGYMSRYYQTHPKPAIAFIAPKEPLENRIYVVQNPFSVVDEAVETLNAAADEVVERLGNEKRPGFVRRLVHKIADLF